MKLLSTILCSLFFFASLAATETPSYNSEEKIALLQAFAAAVQDHDAVAIAAVLEKARTRGINLPIQNALRIIMIAHSERRYLKAALATLFVPVIGIIYAAYKINQQLEVNRAKRLLEQLSLTEIQ